MLEATIRNALYGAPPIDIRPRYFSETALACRDRRIHIDRFSLIAKNVNNSQCLACLFV